MLNLVSMNRTGYVGLSKNRLLPVCRNKDHVSQRNSDVCAFNSSWTRMELCGTEGKCVQCTDTGNFTMRPR